MGTKLDRTHYDDRPSTTGWYGVLSIDVDGNVYHSAARWDGKVFESEEIGHPYARSVAAFNAEAEAVGWAESQPH